MLDSVKIQRRQSEIRQTLAELVGKDDTTDDETRKIEALDAEFRQNEVKYRGALIAEDQERREAGADLETREGRQWDELVRGFELRQVALALDEGRTLDGRTAEVVEELRAQGGFRGVPVPWQALEVRAGETVATGTPDPVQTRPIIDRLFPESMAGRMGAQMISIDSGAVEWPVVTSSVSVGWADGETANVAGPSAYATTDRAMKPNNNLGVQMKITRRSLKQSGAALEAAIRRDMQGAMGAAMDQAVFLGTGANGQPLGVITGQATYGIGLDEVDALASWAGFRESVAAFMAANAAGSPGAVRGMIRPELWSFLDGELIEGTAVSEWDRLTRQMPSVFTTSNGLAAPAGDPLATTALLTTSTGGVAPIFVGAWGAIDVIRDPFSDAQSGGLRITALATLDVTVARPVQLRLLSGLEIEAGGRLMLWGAATGALELRQINGGIRLRGRFPYATEAELARGRFERIETRAFAERIDAGADIHLLSGHDYNKPLASRGAGTLEIRDEAEALEIEATLSDGTSWARDFLEAHRAGLVRGLSPGFRVSAGGERIERRGDGVLRRIERAELFEISTVTRPAYTQAQIEARAWSAGVATGPSNHPLKRWRL